MIAFGVLGAGLLWRLKVFWMDVLGWLAILHMVAAQTWRLMPKDKGKGGIFTCISLETNSKAKFGRWMNTKECSSG